MPRVHALAALGFTAAFAVASAGCRHDHESQTASNRTSLVSSPTLPETAVPAQVPTAIAFWDARHGLLGSGSCRDTRCSAGTISATADGGRSFRVILRTRRPLIALQTAGPGAAIAQMDRGGALRTLDGGRTWRPFRLRFAASFATPSIGLGSRRYFVGNHEALALVSTSDGGRTWHRRAVTDYANGPVSYAMKG